MLSSDSNYELFLRSVLNVNALLGKNCRLLFQIENHLLKTAPQ